MLSRKRCQNKKSTLALLRQANSTLAPLRQENSTLAPLPQENFTLAHLPQENTPSDCSQKASRRRELPSPSPHLSTRGCLGIGDLSQAASTWFKTLEKNQEEESYRERKAVISRSMRMQPLLCHRRREDGTINATWLQL